MICKIFFKYNVSQKYGSWKQSKFERQYLISTFSSLYYSFRNYVEDTSTLNSSTHQTSCHHLCTYSKSLNLIFHLCVKKQYIRQNDPNLQNSILSVLTYTQIHTHTHTHTHTHILKGLTAEMKLKFHFDIQLPRMRQATFLSSIYLQK